MTATLPNHQNPSSSGSNREPTPSSANDRDHQETNLLLSSVFSVSSVVPLTTRARRSITATLPPSSEKHPAP